MVDECAVLKNESAETEWNEANEYAEARTEFIRNPGCKARGNVERRAQHSNGGHPTANREVFIRNIECLFS